MLIVYLSMRSYTLIDCMFNCELKHVLNYHKYYLKCEELLFVNYVF